MALSAELAGKIVNAVSVDETCRKLIQTNPAYDLLFAIPMLGLEATGLAGSARNLLMMAQGKYVGDKEFDEKICLGIALVTANAIRKARIEGVPSVATVHRVHWGVEHEATWVRTSDDSTYAFDWHATLRLRDPMISTEDDFVKAQNATHFVLFDGFA